MPHRKRQGNNPKRRIAPQYAMTQEIRSNLARSRYVGSALHKSKPADYGFVPPVNPRPNKSLCDDLRVIYLREATQLFRSGIQLGMVSSYLGNNCLPKFVWAVDNYGEAYEAKLGGDNFSYHGYRLYRDQRMSGHVIAEWERRANAQNAN